MTRRTRIARIPIGVDELVVSVDDRDHVDVRLWTDTSGVRFPSKHGVTVPRHVINDLINALRSAIPRQPEHGAAAEHTRTRQHRAPARHVKVPV
jgi:hypothetical protein